MEPNKKTWRQSLRQAWNENPMAFLGVGAVVASATPKIINALSRASETHSMSKMRKRRYKRHGW
jgi:hypothetical protein